MKPGKAFFTARTTRYGSTPYTRDYSSSSPSPRRLGDVAQQESEVSGAGVGEEEESVEIYFSAAPVKKRVIGDSVATAAAVPVARAPERELLKPEKR